MTEKERNLADSFRKLHNAHEDLAEKKPGTPEYKDAQRKLTKAEKDLHKQTQTQGNRLQKGAEYRALGAAPNPDYLGYSHEALKEMVEKRNDPGQVGTIGSSWTKLGNAFVELSDALHKSVTKSASEWQGVAADSARDFTGSLSTWFNSAAQGAQLAGNRLTAQAQLAADIRNSLPPPTQFSVADTLRQANAQTDPVAQQQAMSQMRENAAAQEAAHRRAAEMVEKYDKALIDYASTMPAFSPPPTMAGSQQSGQNLVTQLDGGQPQGTRDALQEQTQKPQLNPQQPPGITPGPSQPIPVRTSPHTPLLSSPSPDIRTGQQSFAPPMTTSPYQSSTGGLATSSPGTGGFSTGFVGGATLPPASTAQQPGPGARAGVGPVATPAAGGTAARPGTPGRPGMPGMAGMPAGHAQREADYEHQRADYLVEPDPNAIFGIDQHTTQPVIGE